ncbi:hypothetical protein ACE3MZ_08190 [Paenibacillus sp. WLX1005]|uniref:hypothetical protein n=1 Tax=unclassified Paenibacillus TaxID=185978 RepID=UPI003983E227
MDNDINRYRQQLEAGEVSTTLELTHGEMIALRKALAYLKFECLDHEANLYAGSTSLNSLLGKTLEKGPLAEHTRQFYNRINPQAEQFIADRLELEYASEGRSWQQLDTQSRRTIMEARLYPFPYSGDVQNYTTYDALLPQEGTEHGEQWAQQLADTMYEPPHSEWISTHWQQLAPSMRQLLLVLDYDIELQMNGLLGLLHNIGKREYELLPMLNELGLQQDAQWITPLQMQQRREQAEGNEEYSASLLERIREVERQLLVYRDPAAFYERIFGYADQVLKSIQSS